MWTESLEHVLHSFLPLLRDELPELLILLGLLSLAHYIVLSRCRVSLFDVFYYLLRQSKEGFTFLPILVWLLIVDENSRYLLVCFCNRKIIVWKNWRLDFSKSLSSLNYFVLNDICRQDAPYQDFRQECNLSV